MPGLVACRHPQPLTSADALAWFAEFTSGPTIGYCYAPAAPAWFRVLDAVAHGPRGARDLGDVFELYATTGEAGLRWTQEGDGKGRAIALGRVEAPEGAQPIDLSGAFVLGHYTRLLEGTVRRHEKTRSGEWATLTSARFGSVDVPCAVTTGEVWAHLVEYAVRDEHGNVGVTDALLTGLGRKDGD